MLYSIHGWMGPCFISILIVMRAPLAEKHRRPLIYHITSTKSSFKTVILKQHRDLRLYCVVGQQKQAQFATAKQLPKTTVAL